VLVRSYRGVLAKDLEATNDSYRVRSLTYSHDDDGSLLLNARLPAEEGAVVLAALEAAGDRVRAAALADVDENDSAESFSEPSTERADALVLVAQTALASDSKPVSSRDQHEIVVHVDAATLAHDEDGACNVEAGPALHPETARRLACDSSVIRVLERDGRPLSVGRKTRSVPPALARALRSRDKGCRFPGCTEHRFVDAHHIHHWAHGGRTELGNLVQLCRRHHRLLHEGGYGLARASRGGFLFRRPDGRVIREGHPRRGDREEIARRNRRRRLEITRDRGVPRWDGDRLDLPYVVGVMADGDSRLSDASVA
jgi:hypothetical protein